MDRVGLFRSSVAVAALLTAGTVAAQPAVATPQPAPPVAPEVGRAAGTPVTELRAVGSPAAISDTSAGTTGLQDIVVTAQKRAENLQNVPISVTAVSGAAVANLHAVTIQGLQGTTPNVQINNFSNTPNSAVFTIRGIGVIEPDPYAGNTVSIVVDGVPQFFSTGALVDLLDIDRIETLRGPQGTLFGANTTGGVINVVNALPTDRFGAKGEATLSNYGGFNVNGVVNTPLSDTLSARIAASHDEYNGWVTNVVDGSKMGKRNVQVVRGTLKWSPSSTFDAIASGEYDRGRNGAPIVVNGAYPGEITYVPPGVQNMYQSPCQPGQRCDAPDKYFSANNSVPDVSNLNTYKGTLTLNLRDTAIGDITSITGYKKVNVFEYTDQDGTPLSLADTRRRTRAWQFSQELRTSARITDWWNAIAGAFYIKDHYFLQQDFRLTFANPGLMQVNRQDQENYSVSGFLQNYFDITDTLRAQAGIRYTYERTRMDASLDNLLNPAGLIDFEGTNALQLSRINPVDSKSWNNVGWKLGLDWKITDRILAYGNWARGFKSGGFVGRIGLPSDIGPYNPEKVDTIEVGVKADLLDRRLRVNLAGFHTNYRDLQVAQIYFVNTPTGPVQGNTIQNAGKAIIKGFELEATAAPVNGLTVTGSLAYLDAKYKDFPYLNPLTLQTVNLKGARLQNSPEWSANAGATYTIELGENKVTANALYSYTASKFFTNVLNTPRSLIQPTHIVDANLDWTLPGNRLTVSVWVKNALDNRYLASVYDSPGFAGFANYQPPRRFGITLRANYM